MKCGNNVQTNSTTITARTVFYARTHICSRDCYDPRQTGRIADKSCNAQHEDLIYIKFGKNTVKNLNVLFEIPLHTYK